MVPGTTALGTIRAGDRQRDAYGGLGPLGAFRRRQTCGCTVRRVLQNEALQLPSLSLVTASPMLIPLDVAHHSGMISPTVPI
jgi:hypothetical protein